MNRRIKILVAITLAVLLGSITSGQQSQAALETEATAVKPAKYAVLNIYGSIYENEQIYHIFRPEAHTLIQYLNLIKNAKEDETIKGLIIYVDNPLIGLAKVQQFHQALLDFRQSGKKVYCIFEMELLPGYLVASAADQIIVPPSGALLVYGLSLNVYYFKDLLGKLGIDTDFIPMGKYKTAMEPFTQSTMSEETREMLTSILDEFYGQMLNSISEGRNIDLEILKDIIDQGPFTAEEAKKKDLIDMVAYEEEFMAELEKRHPEGVELIEDYGVYQPSEELSFFNIFSLFTMKPSKRAAKPGKTQIALINCVGPILPGSKEEFPFFENVITFDDYQSILQECREDDSIAAVVLRINSPGGAATVSDLLWKEVVKTKEKKPVVASLSDVAASGGYYLAMGATKIVAEPGTITGSIGVVGGKILFGDLYDKIGINKETLWRGKHSQLFSETSQFSESERKAITKLLETVYKQFVEKAAQGRGMKYEELDKVAQGRIWTGSQAKARGLVDELGGLDEAITLAKSLAEIPEYEEPEIVTYPPQPTFMEFLRRIFSGQVTSFNVYNNLLSTFHPQLGPILWLLDHEPLVALMPYYITIK